MRRQCLAEIAALVLFLDSLSSVAGEMMPEEERRAGYASRNYKWPIPDDHIKPNTDGWIQLMKKRIRQVEATGAENRVEKFDGWKSVLSSALITPNYTEFGWAVTRAPGDLVREIQEALREGFDSAYGEGHDPCIVGGEEARMVNIGDLAGKALHALLPLHEAWAGTKLTPIKGYGLRLYANNSQLFMHLDKIETHVISSIIHIDRSIDFQPGSFPLVIEDLEGTTQHVHLDMGDMFLYESAKCMHGRPIPLNGSWFTSLFLHYAPRDWPFALQDLEAKYAIPDHWEEVRPYDDASNNLPRLTMVDTGMMEPDCPNQWCGSGEAVSWEGPAKPGVTITSHGLEQVLQVESPGTKDEL